MIDRILVIGESPSPKGSTIPLYPFPAGTVGARLQAMTGLDAYAYLDRCDRLNLLTRYPGDNFPVAKAKATAEMYEESGILRGRRVLLLGDDVAGAFDLPKKDILAWRRWKKGAQYAIVPNPTGRNRWYNLPANMEQAQKFLQEVFA